MNTTIDPRAIIHPSAQLGNNVFIGPFSIIGENCIIGDGTQINPHVIIKKNTTIGENNKIFQFCSIGEDPQIRDHDELPNHQDTYLEIGNNNIFREFVFIERGSKIAGASSVTQIGNDNLFCNKTTIGHDNKIGNSNNFLGSYLAGHITVGDHVTFGGGSVVHQFCEIASYSIVGGFTPIGKSVLPFSITSGIHGKTKLIGLNQVRLKRLNFTQESIQSLKKAFLLLKRHARSAEDAVSEIENLKPQTVEVALLLDKLKTFLNSDRKVHLY